MDEKNPFFDTMPNNSISLINKKSISDFSNKISTNIDSVFDKKAFFPLNKSFKKLAGDYYSHFKIKKILEEVDKIIEDNNIQFVEHNVSETVENNSINIVLNIFEGDKN